MASEDWIAVDWGTSHMRLWHLRGSDVLAKVHSADGMGGLTRDGFEPALKKLIAELPQEPQGDVLRVFACGMAGSRQGWAEAPYATAPCTPPSAAEAVRAPVRDGKLLVHILPGVKQTSPADVMRGEETQVAGFLALNKDFDGIICLPGTHTKWVQVSAGEIVSFRTYLTGEMFALLSEQSVLRHSVNEDGWENDAFLAAVSHAMGRPAGVASDLFALRAESLLDSLDPAVARSRLSGLLIGMELAAARPYWLGQNIAVLGARGIANAYCGALQAQGVPVTLADAERMTLEGLKAARASLQEIVT